MKIISLFLCGIVLCVVAISKTNASTSVSSLDRSSFLKEHYYGIYPELFKKFEHQGKKIIVNKIASMPEILNCGTPVGKLRIINLLKELNGLLARLEGLFQGIKAFKKEYVGDHDESDEIVKSNIHIDFAKNMRDKFSGFDPLTINEMIASLSVLSDYISLSQTSIFGHLKEISDKTYGVQASLNKAAGASVTGFVQKASIQAPLEHAQFLQGKQNKLLSLLDELNNAQSIVQNASHLLADFYLQTRSAEGVSSCPTDLYLSYLNNSISGSDALTLE